MLNFWLRYVLNTSAFQVSFMRTYYTGITWQPWTEKRWGSGSLWSEAVLWDASQGCCEHFRGQLHHIQYYSNIYMYTILHYVLHYTCSFYNLNFISPQLLYAEETVFASEEWKVGKDLDMGPYMGIVYSLCPHNGTHATCRLCLPFSSYVYLCPSPRVYATHVHPLLPRHWLQKEHASCLRKSFCNMLATCRHIWAWSQAANMLGHYERARFFIMWALSNCNTYVQVSVARHLFTLTLWVQVRKFLIPSWTYM